MDSERAKGTAIAHPANCGGATSTLDRVSIGNRCSSHLHSPHPSHDVSQRLCASTQDKELHYTDPAQVTEYKTTRVTICLSSFLISHTVSVLRFILKCIWRLLHNGFLNVCRFPLCGNIFKIGGACVPPTRKILYTYSNKVKVGPKLSNPNTL